MPAPLLTFEGGAAAQFCACAPPDTDGDVGPNHYVEAINQAFAVFDKSGSMLAGRSRTTRSSPRWVEEHLAELAKTGEIHLLCMISRQIAG